MKIIYSTHGSETQEEAMERVWAPACAEAGRLGKLLPSYYNNDGSIKCHDDYMREMAVFREMLQSCRLKGKRDEKRCIA